MAVKFPCFFASKKASGNKDGEKLNFLKNTASDFPPDFNIMNPI